MAQRLQWGTRPYEFLRECAQEVGDTFTLDFGPSGVYVLFSRPDAIRTIFTADPAVLHAGKGNSILRPVLGEGSLLLLEEGHHQRERRMLLPAFHAKRIDALGAAVREATLDATATWNAGDIVVAQETTQRITLHVILRAVFGHAATGGLEDLAGDLLALLNDSKFNLALVGQLHTDDAAQEGWRAFRDRFRRVDAAVRREILRRREGGDDSGMVGLLLSATDEAGRPRSEEEIRDEVMTLVVAGYETTATALAWSLFFVHRSERVRDDLRAALEALGADPDPGALARLPYLEAVCKETLRIRPVIPVVARQVQRPIEIEGIPIPAGITVSPCIYLAHHRSSVYPEPDTFLPERFVGPSAPTPYEYLPFGGGGRRCIGMGLALQEMKIVLGTLLARFEFELPDPEVRSVRRWVTIAPSGGPRMRVHRRLR